MLDYGYQTELLPTMRIHRLESRVSIASPAKINLFLELLAKRKDGFHELETLMVRVLEKDWTENQLDISIPQPRTVTYKGKKGKLYVTGCGRLLTAIKKLDPHNRDIPKTGGGLSKRLHSCTFLLFQVLDDKSAPEFPELKRTATKRPIGFFVEDE